MVESLYIHSAASVGENRKKPLLFKRYLPLALEAQQLVSA
jgi:hypothetical protein